VNRLVSGAAVAALTLLASLPMSAAHAAVALTVSDAAPLPGAAITVSGDGDDCPAAGGNPGTYSVRLRYTVPAGTTADVTETGNVSAVGTFTANLTIPENAVTEAPASITATATCAGGVQNSNTVALTIGHRSGTLDLSVATVAAGGDVTVTADNCYGGEYLVVYGAQGGDPNNFESGASGTPAADRSFSVVLTIPATTAAGDYDVYALCPGTQYTTQPLAVTAGAESTEVAAATVEATIGGGFTGGSTTPIASAPTAVEGVANFTG
jgi:hypothetical protein